LDFHLWGYLKDRVYTPIPNSVDDLKVAIQREIRMMSKETCAAVVRNFRERIVLVNNQKGRHLEHML